MLPQCRIPKSKTAETMVVRRSSLVPNATEEAAWGARAWKSHDWDVLDRLHAKGYISDPKGKAKSVVLSPEGLRRARELFEQHFARKSPPTEREP